MDAKSIQALRTLKDNRRNLTREQLNTLRGQVFAGDAEGAMRGLKKLLKRSAKDTGNKEVTPCD